MEAGGLGVAKIVRYMPERTILGGGGEGNGWLKKSRTSPSWMGARSPDGLLGQLPPWRFGFDSQRGGWRRGVAKIVRYMSCRAGKNHPRRRRRGGWRAKEKLDVPPLEGRQIP